jgi:serine/threonine protein kinase
LIGKEDGPWILTYVKAHKKIISTNGLELDDFHIIDEIGSGATGTVYKAKLKNHANYEDDKTLDDTKGEYYAIKKIKLDNKSKDMMKEVCQII